MQYVEYIRVSTEEQGKSGLGLSAQKNAIARFLESDNGELVGSFKDVCSGSKVNRAGLMEAIAECKLNGATLVVAKLDRLSRDGFKVLNLLEELGVNYVEAESPNDSTMVKELKFILAKDERSKISSRTKAALAELKKRGVKLGSPQNLSDKSRAISAAVRREKALLNEENRKAYGFIKMGIEAGKNLSAIANELNEYGFKTPKGGKFYPQTVKNINKLYA